MKTSMRTSVLGFLKEDNEIYQLLFTSLKKILILTKVIAGKRDLSAAFHLIKKILILTKVIAGKRLGPMCT